MPWLEPDWILDMSTGHLARGRLQRPRIKTRNPPRPEIDVATLQASSLSKAQVSTIPQPASSATSTTPPQPSPPSSSTPTPTRPGWRETPHRLPPHFQGVGLGTPCPNSVPEFIAPTHKPYFSTTSHPALIRPPAPRSPFWRMTRNPG